MGRKGFSLIEMMIALLILAVALVGLVGAIIWDTLSVNIQSQKNKVLHISNLVLEEMASMDLDSIIAQDWDSWVKTNNYDYGLKNLSITVSYPLVYPEEEEGNANRNGYTYKNGIIWSGFNFPYYTRGLLAVNLDISWYFRDNPMHYRVSTLFSELGR